MKSSPIRGVDATLLTIGRDNNRFDISLSGNFLADLKNAPEYQTAANAFVKAVGGRMRCGPPDVFFCRSGISVRIELCWPVDVAVVNSEFQTWLRVRLTDRSTLQVATCVVLNIGFRQFATPFDEARWTTNLVRNRIDDGTITFEDARVGGRPNPQQVIQNQHVIAAKSSPIETQSFILGKAHSLGFETAEVPGEVWIADPWDAEYLGINTKDLLNAAYILQARKLLVLDKDLQFGKPSDQLIANGLTTLEGPRGTQRRQTLSLSGLPNKDSFRKDLAEALERREDLALVFIDLDNFKKVNDTQGHQAGDRCLENAVEAIGMAVGRKGSLYRWGGDEFAVCLVDFSTDEALATGERIRRSVEQAKTGGTTPVTASIGVAATDGLEVLSAEKLLEAADQALYGAKNNGRNRVTAWRRDDG